MKLSTDSTSRIIVLALCICIVIMRLLRPDIPFDQYSLGALALAALIVIVPVFARSADKHIPAEAPLIDADEVAALTTKLNQAGLIIAESGDAYSALLNIKPVSTALAGAEATLELRLHSLAEQANVSIQGAGGHACLDAMNAAGITTGVQYEALSKLLNMLSAGANTADSAASAALLNAAVRVIEMLDGTIA